MNVFKIFVKLKDKLAQYHIDDTEDLEESRKAVEELMEDERTSPALVLIQGGKSGNM